MKLSKLAFLCPLILLPVFSYGETTIGASSTSTANSTTHTVVVGGQSGNLTYDPMNTIASPGDDVVFLMRAKNHTVTQSLFETPCKPLNQTSGTPGIFSSFLAPLDAQDDSHGYYQYKIRVNDTRPIWFYCSQPTHCLKGMVGAINGPLAGNTVKAYQDLAMMSGISDPVIPQVFGGAIIPPVRPMHTVVVGGKDLRVAFEPANITVNPGTIVRFIMRANHSVTESDFKNPCQPLIQTSGKMGFHSGFISPSNDSNDSTGDSFFDLAINDTKPVWFYCSQTSNCLAGMVGAINASPEGNTTFDKYKKLAMESNIVTPSIPLVSGGTAINPSTSYEFSYDTSTPESSGSGDGNADVAEVSTVASKAKSIAEGIAIGVVGGAVFLILLIVLTVYCCCCRKRKSRAAPGPERGDGGFVGYAASKYRSINSLVPGVNVNKHLDYEPLVTPGERAHAPNDDYHPSGAYDPPQPTSLGQYSTAWDHHK
ncbi:hypothetical protein PILCRDRAFT_827751 [Piloderma croceum F 1598]|uniref:Cupredoxin n=1 Tax=Piloderma croceum (strain F 1598) TaxID=765440 RepID=A0A0C3F4D7_PILCF|nr:hypothetical protein PILCRDRAFT_827751 [Piloderma croceum F 1598]